MSRIAKAPVDLPKGVTATVSPESVTIKGAKGTLSVPLTRGVSVVQADQKLEIKYTDPGLSRTQAGAEGEGAAAVAAVPGSASSAAADTCSGTTTSCSTSAPTAGRAAFAWRGPTVTPRPTHS